MAGKRLNLADSALILDGLTETLYMHHPRTYAATGIDSVTTLTLQQMSAVMLAIQGQGTGAATLVSAIQTYTTNNATIVATQAFPTPYVTPGAVD